ncbi:MULTISPECIES: hypothetical protein [Halobacterium]|uniref:hypothetical protein n=1 Tax=Halobacterium TaxID=2239 RepID=UPI00073F60CE|nr:MULTISPECIES: hypothetical protein [Halobacterium]MCG1004929.1 hypothetical protein [Halobacterium noricense]
MGEMLTLDDSLAVVQVIFKPAPKDWTENGPNGESVGDVATDLRSGSVTGFKDPLFWLGIRELEERDSSSKDKEAAKIVEQQRGEQGFLTITKNSQEVASLAGGFTGTRTMTIPAGEVPPGETTVTVAGDQRMTRFDATLEWQSRTVTESPTIQTEDGRTLYEDNGRLANATTVAIEEPLSPATTLEIQSAGGGIGYEVAYPIRVAAESATVSVNGEEYAYPSAFDESGVLTAPVDVNSSALTLGQNEMRVQAPTVDGIQPDVSVIATYNGSRVVTNQPSVTITNADGDSQTVEVPDSQLRNGRLYGNATVNLPAGAFTAGENTIRVQTTDWSEVQAVMTARGIYNQTKEFEKKGVF